MQYTHTHTHTHTHMRMHMRMRMDMRTQVPAARAAAMVMRLAVAWLVLEASTLRGRMQVETRLSLHTTTKARIRTTTGASTRTAWVAARVVVSERPVLLLHPTPPPVSKFATPRRPNQPATMTRTAGWGTAATCRRGMHVPSAHSRVVGTTAPGAVSLGTVVVGHGMVHGVVHEVRAATVMVVGPVGRGRVGKAVSEGT